MDNKKYVVLALEECAVGTATARMRNCNLISSQQRLDLPSLMCTHLIISTARGRDS